MSTLMYTHALDLSLSNAYAFYLFCIEISKFIGSKCRYSNFQIFVAKSLTITSCIIQMNKSKNLYCHQ